MSPLLECAGGSVSTGMLRCVLQVEVLRDRQGLKKAEENWAGDVSEKPMAIVLFLPQNILP